VAAVHSRGFALATLFAINVFNFYDRQVLGVVVEPIRKEFGLSDMQIGALTTWMTVLYACVGLPLGRIADSWSRKKLLAIGVALWSALTAAGGLVTSYTLLMLSRLGVAVGEATCAPTGTSWIGDLVPAGKRARALAVFMLGVPIGSALSFAISGPVAQAYGWRRAVMLAAGPALLLIPALLLLQEPKRGAAEPQYALHRPSAWSLLAIPTFWWIIASGALVNFNLYTLATFFPAFLTRFHHMSISQAGLFSGLGYAVAGVSGGLAAGFAGDWALRKAKNARMMMAAAAALLAAPAAYFGIQAPAGSVGAAVTLIMLCYGLMNMYYGNVYSAIQDIVTPSLRGTAMAVYFMAMYLLGASFGPLLTGRLSDYFARQAALSAGSGHVTEAARAVGLHDAMYVIPVLAIGLALVLYAGSRTIARDMDRRDGTLKPVPAPHGV
jgi:predicted MFS family arabinose efflux permease